MAVQQVDVFRVNIEDRPGSLAGVLNGTSGAGLNVMVLAAFSTGSGKGHAYVVPDDTGAFREHVEAKGIETTEYAGFLLSGADRIGVGKEVTVPVADAGVNIVVATATVASGNYNLLLVVDKKDTEAAAKALGV